MTAGEVPHILFQDKMLWCICVEGADEIIGCAVYLLTSVRSVLVSQCWGGSIKIYYSYFAARANK